MQKNERQLPEIKLIGLTIRTNNENEVNPQKAKISALAEQYWTGNYANQIPNRANPGKTYAVYTEYEGDERGDYTYFLGEEVTQIDSIPEGFVSFTLPPSKYVQFTTEPGQIPEVIINAWRQIWLMGDKELGGKRAFQADLEVVDVKNLNPEKAVFDIFIGIQ